MTEKQLMTEIIRRCEARGIWWVHLDTPYRNLCKYLIGFPDLLLCGPGGVAFRELKSSRAASLRPGQRAWRRMLEVAGQDYALWTPSDLVRTVDTDLDRLAAPRLASPR